MPTHAHVLHHREVTTGLRRAMASYARWRHHERGTAGRVWLRLDEPTRSVTAQKRRRDERYVHLNPCRDGLVRDPLGWAFSTHRDAVGLAIDPVR